jgi:hypothetical protein
MSMMMHNCSWSKKLVQTKMNIKSSMLSQLWSLTNNQKRSMSGTESKVVTNSSWSKNPLSITITGLKLAKREISLLDSKVF